MHEFKLFKELISDGSGCNLTDLVSESMRIVRTFDVEKLTIEVSLNYFHKFQGQCKNQDKVFVVFDGFCGIYKNSNRSNAKSAERIFLKDVALGTLIGHDIHYD